MEPILKILDLGFGASIQDRGRLGWRRFGVPRSGCMDAHAGEVANRLLENQPDAPMVELLLQGAKFEMLADGWLALCGADVIATIPLWRAHHAKKGEILKIQTSRSGVWAYLAVAGGFAWPESFGSASYYARADLGQALSKGAILARNSGKAFELPGGVAGRAASWSDYRSYAAPPRIRVWPGPQWKNISLHDRETFLTVDWKVSPESDRVGYRLEGPPLKPDPSEILSEGVALGSIQIPESGQPIITMPDGPTVGGYPKIAVIDPDFLPWAAQARPGQKLRFELAT